MKNIIAIHLLAVFLAGCDLVLTYPSEPQYGLNCDTYPVHVRKADEAYRKALECAETLGLEVWPARSMYVCTLENEFVCPGLGTVVEECASHDQTIYVARHYYGKPGLYNRIRLATVNHLFRMNVIWLGYWWKTESELKENQAYWDILDCVGYAR